MEIFYSSAFSSKTKRDIGLCLTVEMMLTYRATNALSTNSGCGAVLTVFCLPEVGRCRQDASCQQKQCGVPKAWEVTILTLEHNPLKRFFLYISKKSSQEDFALKSKLRPWYFFQHLPIFAGNSRFTGISQLRAGKTRSKRPRSHCLSTGHLLPYK